MSAGRSFGADENLVAKLGDVDAALFNVATSIAGIPSPRPIIVARPYVPAPYTTPHSFASTARQGAYRSSSATYTYTKDFPTYRLQNTGTLNKFRVPSAGDYDFIGPTLFGQSSRLVPGGGLSGHENVLSVFNQPTHTIARHVGQSFTSLQQRLNSSKNLQQVSTFRNRAEAEKFLSDAIDARQTDINTFLAQPLTPNANGNRLALSVPLNANTGNILIRGNSFFTNGSGVKLIIDKVPNPQGNPYTVVTGYPTP
jgi:hypothetical protein